MMNLSILYAEDHPTTREINLSILEKYFQNIYVANDGEEALKIYDKSKIDILLLDIGLPKIDGLEVAKYIRKKNPTIPIIMLTAHSERGILLRAVELKIDKYLLKHSDRDIFISTLVQVATQLKKSNSIRITENLSWEYGEAFLDYKQSQIPLTKKEYKLIKILAHAIHTYTSKDALLYQVYEDEIPDDTYDNKLVQLIYRLNKKIIDLTNIKTPIVENNYSFGYKLKSFEEEQ